ncbi:MAG TPA: ImmA/IrrE family metallo-endopeptidase [Bacillus bacterium]|nr:ImmA/IrrE family metallo-endopeptidase [Bacillus sp. (in: firmicutes)]
MDINKLVGQLIKKYGTSNPYKIAGQLKIAIVFEPLGSIYGYYSRTHRTKVIHINEAVTERKQLFTCAHELGHAILHQDVNTPFLKKHTFFSTDKIEVEANTFAVELLCRKEAVDDVITVHEAIEEYGVPKQLALLKSLGK